jgi:SPP1 family predicted phage head-tail adaptor
MQAGKKRHKITIQQIALGSAGTYGGQAKSWSTFAQPWAEIRPSGGKKLMAAQAVQSKVDVEITIRYLAGVVPKMRVSYNSAVYDIEAVINRDMANKEMTLLCSTGVNEG